MSQFSILNEGSLIRKRRSVMAVVSGWLKLQITNSKPQRNPNPRAPKDRGAPVWVVEVWLFGVLTLELPWCWGFWSLEFSRITIRHQVNQSTIRNTDARLWSRR